MKWITPRNFHANVESSLKLQGSWKRNRGRVIEVMVEEAKTTKGVEMVDEVRKTRCGATVGLALSGIAAFVISPAISRKTATRSRMRSMGPNLRLLQQRVWNYRCDVITTSKRASSRVEPCKVGPFIRMTRFKVRAMGRHRYFPRRLFPFTGFLRRLTL